MLAIKLRRTGKKRQASFRIVVTEKRSKLQGRFIEDLGWLDPRTNAIEVNGERVLFWIKSGAQPTDTAYNLLVKKGVVKGKKRPVHKKSKKTKDAAQEAVAAVAPEAAA